MVSSTSSEEFFIVLTLPEEEITPLIKIQQIIAENYDLFPQGEYPQLHVTLNKINKKDAEAAKKIMKKAVQKSPPVEIIITEFNCFGDKFLVLEIQNTPTLEKLAANLHRKLSRQNLSTVDNYQNWKFHLTLISDFFSPNKIPKIDMNKMCLNLSDLSQPIYTQAKSLELWRPTLKKEEKIIASFKL